MTTCEHMSSKIIRICTQCMHISTPFTGNSHIRAQKHNIAPKRCHATVWTDKHCTNTLVLFFVAKFCFCTLLRQTAAKRHCHFTGNDHDTDALKPKDLLEFYQKKMSWTVKRSHFKLHVHVKCRFTMLAPGSSLRQVTPHNPISSTQLATKPPTCMHIHCQ